MPKLETPQELADDIANKLGIYCDHPEETFEQHEGGEHCRIGFCIEMTDRIRKAAQNEQKMDPKPENALHLRMEVVEAGDDKTGTPRVILAGSQSAPDGREGVKAFAKHLYQQVSIWVSS